MKLLFSSVFIICILLTYNTHLVATDLKFHGSCGYSLDIEKQAITISIDTITNSSNNTSGSIKVSVCLTYSPFNGETQTAFNLAEYQFSEVLETNYCYAGVQRTLQTQNPKQDEYHIVFLLWEYTEEGWVVRDYRNFKDRITFKKYDTWADFQKTQRRMELKALQATNNFLATGDFEEYMKQHKEVFETFYEAAKRLDPQTLQFYCSIYCNSSNNTKTTRSKEDLEWSINRTKELLKDVEDQKEADSKNRSGVVTEAYRNQLIVKLRSQLDDYKTQLIYAK